VCKALEDIAAEIKLSPDKVTLLERTKKSDLVPRDLESMLQDIIKRADASLKLK